MVPTTGNFGYKYRLPPASASANFVFGADLDLGEKADPEAREFQEAIVRFISCVADFNQALPIYRLIPTPLYYRSSNAVRTVYNIGKKYLDSNMEKIQRCVEKGEKVKGQSLIEQWMLEKKMSEDQMIMSAVSMFAAGVDTVSLADTCSYVPNATWRDAGGMLAGCWRDARRCMWSTQNYKSVPTTPRSGGVDLAAC